MKRPGGGASAYRHAYPRRHIVRWILVGLLVIVLALGGWVLLRAQNAVDNATQGKGGTAIDILLPRPLAGEETGRVNILLVGNSFDDEGHDGAALTDSIMVASMNLVSHDVTLISIPRDFWVQYGGKEMKVNAVFPTAAAGSAGAAVLGDYQKGLAELSTVVTRITGLRIDHRVLVGYTALKDTVNAVGGIDVVIDSPDPRGIYDPNTNDLRLANGPQHLDGQKALDLSRARNHKKEGAPPPYGIPDAGYGRDRNQRMVLAALMDKVKHSPALANPATLVAIFDSVSVNVRTDLTVSQIRRTYDLAAGGGGEPRSLSIRGTEEHLLIKDYNNEAVGASYATVPTAGKFDYTQIQRYVRESLQP